MCYRLLKKLSQVFLLASTASIRWRLLSYKSKTNVPQSYMTHCNHMSLSNQIVVLFSYPFLSDGANVDNLSSTFPRTSIVRFMYNLTILQPSSPTPQFYPPVILTLTSNICLMFPSSNEPNPDPYPFHFNVLTNFSVHHIQAKYFCGTLWSFTGLTNSLAMFLMLGSLL